jgi:hypothetical protein
MKSDRRHELQQNELADWLGERIDKLKPHAAQITLAVAVIVLVIFIAGWWLGGSGKESAANWSSYFAALNQPRDRDKALDKVLTDKRGTSAALWAQLTLGDDSARQGVAALFTDRSEAKKQLDKAAEAYKAVEAASANDPGLQGRARLGLAQVYEAQCQPEDAQKWYEKAAATLKDPALSKAASADAERMKRKDQVELLAWFAGQTPKKPAPFPGFGGGIPGLPNDLPARPDISPPVMTPPSSLGLDNIGTTNPAAPAPELPKPDATTPPPTTPPAVPSTPTPGDAKAGEPKTEQPKVEQPKPGAEKSETPKPDSAAPAKTEDSAKKVEPSSN